jgi:hypothetical protein
MDTNYNSVKYLAIFASLKKCTKRFVDTRSRHTAISFIATDMTNVPPEAQKAALVQQIPMNRLGSADEIGNTALDIL